jgi:hypothetical protein
VTILGWVDADRIGHDPAKMARRGKVMRPEDIAAVLVAAPAAGAVL